MGFLKYRKLGARIPKGILLVGASGTGKTLLAKAIAGEADVPFFSVAGSEFMEMLVGVGSSRARDLFRMAKEAQPSLIFIDEIDAIGRQRGMGIGGGHDEREQTLNQILIEMDGFDARTNVIVLGGTNRGDMLDPALIRPGRFDRRVTIPLPDLEDRREILAIHATGKPLAGDVTLDKIAKRTVGFSGADLENMLNESAILTARENREVITERDLEEATLKVTLGSERKTLQTDEEKKMTAYHEAGHALVASNVPDMDPVHRVTIVARGGSLGHTSFPPERDRYNETQTRLTSMIATMLGGRAAEEVVFDEFTIGAASDIEHATELSRKMVTEYGMSKLGPVSYDGADKKFWLAKELSEAPMYSQEVAAKIDSEMKRIIDECYVRAKEILKKKRAQLDAVAAALVEKETLTGDEYLMILQG
ncbi:MAG: ATP-dependent metalloprotease FtsH, cell division protease FtsH [candidate division WWE3 bacterium GW2011_GWC1_47_10]|uniref:ATP-dependent metalloprotease FtsH, cell division protease FtsH n=1 Tax=candidate division WWE3 bacterium GW2011_GWC1_47_10 TaxID=1619122 RepID=A0A0G1T9A5_UNCKA|nr:MAG: ATP-dependent metalloprotease FtsH, cell division protease FtsH [candidate division WWE3 bacterium GW2011_GWC1_47_10]